MQSRALLAAVLGAALGAMLPARAQTGPALELFTRADKGACIACHQLPPGVGPASRATLGPALAGERMRALGKEGIRDAIEDPMRQNPDTVMPPYGRHRILDSKEIARLVEFLRGLP